MSKEAPKRAIEVVLKISADDEAALSNALYQESIDIDREGLREHMVCGSDSSLVASVTRRDVTHDQYFAEVDAWLAENREVPHE